MEASRAVARRDGAADAIKMALASHPTPGHIFADGGCAGSKPSDAMAEIKGPTIKIVRRPPGDGRLRDPSHGRDEADDRQKTGNVPSQPQGPGPASQLSEEQAAKRGEKWLGSFEPDSKGFVNTFETFCFQNIPVGGICTLQHARNWDHMRP